jgi:hypothetical protein
MRFAQNCSGAYAPFMRFAQPFNGVDATPPEIID